MWSSSILAPPMLLLLLVVRVARTGNGYVAAFSAKSQIMGTRVAMLNGSANTEIARLSEGFTISMWLRFRDVEKPIGYSMVTPFSLQTTKDSNFMQPFAGLHGGWEFGANAPPTIATLPAASQHDWHHYALSWDAASGARSHYVDGKLAGVPDIVSNDFYRDWLDHEPYLLLGLQCTETISTTTYARCNHNAGFDGEMDDVAVFAGVLSAASIEERWNRSLTDRLVAGLEPSLVLLYNFNAPPALGEAGGRRGWVPNLGSAGVEYDLSLGALPKESIFGKHFLPSGMSMVPFLPPHIVPSTDSSAWAVPKALDSAAPIVVTAAAGANVTHGYGPLHTLTTPDPFLSTLVTTTADPSGAAVELHVVPRMRPTVPTTAAFLQHAGGEDRPLWIKARGSSPSGIPWTVHITRLTSKGRLYSVPTSISSSLDHPILTGQQLPAGSAAYVMYMPDRNSVGSDSFAYELRLAELEPFSATAGGSPGAASVAPLASDEVNVSISIANENDQPIIHSSSIELVEDESAGGVLVALNASDAEVGTPLEIVITSLPTKGRLFQTADGTLRGARTAISHPYSLFDVASTFSQYLDRVLAVSSFWNSVWAEGAATDH